MFFTQYFIILLINIVRGKVLFFTNGTQYIGKSADFSDLLYHIPKIQEYLYYNWY